jgi:hypothetical protein
LAKSDSDSSKRVTTTTSDCLRRTLLLRGSQKLAVLSSLREFSDWNEALRTLPLPRPMLILLQMLWLRLTRAAHCLKLPHALPLRRTPT